VCLESIYNSRCINKKRLHYSCYGSIAQQQDQLMTHAAAAPIRLQEQFKVPGDNRSS
jgi:hypothetical protein